MELQFQHRYGATTGTKFVGLLASAIASNGECLELTLHGKILVCYRHDLYEGRSDLLLTIPAVADRSYRRIT
jgi:hypothetical protein